MQNYAQIEKELLAIVFGVEKFHSYLYGKLDVTVESDHKPLEAIFKKSLSGAPPRLQRMLLRLQKYSLNVQYKKGKEMYVADALSRIKWVEELENSLDEVTVNVISTDVNECTGITEDIIKQKTKEDSTLQLLKEFTLERWPDCKNQTPVAIHAYWNFKEEISYVNGVLFKMNRTVVPKELRRDVLKNLHKSHQGIEKTLRLARDLVYWPGMNAEIKDLISSCDVCNAFCNRQVKEPLMPHDIPDLPWQKLGADLLELHGKTYLIIVDYYSKYIEFDELKVPTSNNVIKRCKHQFARHGIPETLHTDNGPQFNAREFKQLCKAYGVHHTTSPRYPKSNGLAEKSVQTLKRLMKKSSKEGKDVFQSLLDYRNTPVVGDASPAQLLFGRRTRTTLPTSQELLKPKISDPVHVKKLLKENQETQKCYYDTHTKALSHLEEGDVVRIKDGQQKEAKKAVVVAPRSYLVEDSFGHIYRRNRNHLISKSECPPLYSEPDSEDISVKNKTPPKKVNTPQKAAVFPCPPEIVENPSNCKSKLPINEGQVTTSQGRAIKPPIRLNL